MTKPVFSVMVGLEDLGVHNNFSAAFKQFWQAIMDMLEGGTSWQMLDTTNFLVMFTPDGRRLPLDFYDARDLAYDIGLLEQVEEGKPNLLEEPTLPAWQQLVAERYQRLPLEHLAAMQRDFVEHINKLLTLIGEVEEDIDSDDAQTRELLNSMKEDATSIQQAVSSEKSVDESDSPSISP